MNRICVIIPALNEERTIADVIQAIPKEFGQARLHQVIVVNDGSRDETAAIALRHGAEVVSHRQPRGVGAAFHTGLKAALSTGADIIVNIDADGQFNPQDIQKLLEPIFARRAQFVTASRFADPRLMPDMPELKRWGNRQVARIVNILTGKSFTDVSCGFRAYTREAALRLTLFGQFTYTQETFIDLAFKGIEIAEVPIKVRGEREHGKSRVASNLWRYGLKSATIMFRAGLNYRPYYFIAAPGVVIFLFGAAAGLFVLWHFIQTGQTSPYRSLVPGSGILIIIGFLLLFLSMLADMLHRNRMVMEEALYLARKQAYGKKLTWLPPSHPGSLRRGESGIQNEH